jgi:TonB family protein
VKRLLVVVFVAAGCGHAPPPPAAPPPRASAPALERSAPRPDADDEMKVSGTLGTLNDEDIAGPFERRWGEITSCFTQAKSRLWYLEGKVELKFRVAHSGDPKAVYVSSSSVGSYDVERCILAIARELHFSKPHGGGEAEFTYPIEFHGKAALATWDEARVGPFLRKPKPRRDVLDCKKQAQRGLPSSLTMTLYVAPGGKITSAGLAADAPIDDGLASCLVGKAQLWRLDDPLGKIAKATVSMNGTAAD